MLGASETGVVPAMTILPGNAVTNSPATLKVNVGTAFCNGIVDIPIISPLAPSDTHVPATVISGKFETMVVLAILTAFGSSVTTWLVSLKVDIAIQFRESIVDMPMTRPLAPRDTGVSPIVMTCALLNITPSIARPFARMIAAPSAMVSMNPVVCELGGMSEIAGSQMYSTDAASDTAVLSLVGPGLLCDTVEFAAISLPEYRMRIWPPTMKNDGRVANEASGISKGCAPPSIAIVEVAGSLDAW